MNKGQIIGTVIFVSLVLFLVLCVGLVGILILTKLGLFSQILVAAIKAFTYCFLIFIVIPAGIVALFLRGAFWGFKQTWLSGADIKDTYSNWRAAKKAKA